jgi:hypothetical protein
VKCRNRTRKNQNQNRNRFQPRRSQSGLRYQRWPRRSIRLLPSPTRHTDRCPTVVRIRYTLTSCRKLPCIVQDCVHPTSSLPDVIRARMDRLVPLRYPTYLRTTEYSLIDNKGHKFCDDGNFQRGRIFISNFQLVNCSVL